MFKKTRQKFFLGNDIYYMAVVWCLCSACICASGICGVGICTADICGRGICNGGISGGEETNVSKKHQNVKIF